MEYGMGKSGLGLRKAAGYRKVVRALGFSDGGKFWGKKF